MVAVVVGGHPITVTKFTSCGTEVQCYRNELDAVLKMINNGSLGQGNVSGWGSIAHTEAIHKVQEAIDQFWRDFERMNNNEDRGTDG